MKDGITVWQAYSEGAGQKIPKPSFMSTQDVSGLKKVGEWSQESAKTLTQRQQATARAKYHSNTVTAYSCLEPACAQTFTTLQEADGHVDTGRNVMLQEEESVYDTVRRQWTAITTSVNGQSQKTASTEWQVSKTTEHARAVPAINVTKWRTTNKVLPRSFASRQSARGERLVKSMGAAKRRTLLVCLRVSSEKLLVIIHMIIPFILLLLVKMFATTRRRSGLSFSCWLRSPVAG